MTKRRFETPDDERFAMTKYVCRASYDEKHSLWWRWCHLGGIQMEQVGDGWSGAIGHLTLAGGGERKQPVVAAVFWDFVFGERVAFVEMVSKIQDRDILDAWESVAFPNMVSHANAANFHNIVWPIVEATQMDGRAGRWMRDLFKIEQYAASLPTELNERAGRGPAMHRVPSLYWKVVAKMRELPPTASDHEIAEAYSCEWATIAKELKDQP